MRVEEGRFLLGYLLPQVEAESAVTRKILAAMPAGKSEYRPNANCRTALELAWHIAEVELEFLDAVIHQKFEDTLPRPADVKSCAGVAEWYARNFAERMPRLQALTGEELTTPVDFIGLRNDPAVAYLNIAIRHSVHHRGQLSTYLRAIGEKVPAIYVESADEPWPEVGPAQDGRRPPAF